MSGVFWANGTKDRRPVVSREYGHRDPGYARGWHTGVDTVAYGINHAPQAGVVTFVGYQGAYGNTVIVRAADGTTHRTAHGKTGGFLVRLGQRVEAGQRLMVQGTTGRSTGVHNHQEVILPSGNFIDPIAWTVQKLKEDPPFGGGGSSTPTPTPTPKKEQQDMAYQINVEGNIFTVSAGQVAHAPAGSLIDVVRNVLSANDERHELNLVEAGDLLDALGVPRSIVDLKGGRVIDPVDGKLKAGAMWNWARAAAHGRAKI